MRASGDVPLVFPVGARNTEREPRTGTAEQRECIQRRAARESRGLEITSAEPREGRDRLPN